MSESSKRPPRNTPASAWVAPISDWRHDVSQARARAKTLTNGELRDERATNETHALRELAVTFEELSVAEEELRAQNEQLEQTYLALKDAHEELERERARDYALFHHAPVAYIVTDGNSVIAKANLASSVLLGSLVEHLIGKPLAVFVQNDSRRRFRALLSAIAIGETDSATISLDIAPRGAPMIQAEVTVDVHPATDDDIHELRWLIIDQTQRLRREELEQRRAAELEALVAARTADLERAQQLKDQLIATVSHEFRTALGAIGGYAELLVMGLRGPLQTHQLADIERIQRAYTHLSTLVDDLLSYNKIAAGQVMLQLEHVPLADVLAGLADLVAPQAAARHISVDFVEDASGTVIHADPERVRQIVLNLLSNAVKFADVNGHVSVSRGVDEAQAFVEVRDTGPGIPFDKLEVIFEPFVRLGSSSPIPGSGLGLAISREMARAMGGDLTVTSVVGVGTRFTLRLPLSTRLAAESPAS